MTEAAARRSRSARLRAVLAPALMLLLTVGVAIPLAIALTPPRETSVAGQYVAVGGTTPTGGWLGDVDDLVEGSPTTWPEAVADGFEGPAELRQIGLTTVELRQIQVRGPLRPLLELGPLVHTREADDLLDPAQGPAARTRAIDAITDALRAWWFTATLLVVLLSIAVVALCTVVRVWAGLGRASRHPDRTVVDVWHAHSRQLRRDGVIAVLGAVLAWGALSYVTWQDTTDGLAGVSSARDLVGAVPVELEPAGPVTEGVTGAVIGDSRASRIGGPLVADPDASDTACGRSSDSLAAQLARLQPDDVVLNLACPSATIQAGLLGEQQRGGEVMAPQVSRLLQLPDLRYVVVMIGPNDLAWTDFLRYCYAVDECDDRFTTDQFAYRLAEFDRAYGDLLAALASLPSAPQVVIVGSYDVFALDAECADTEGPAAHPGLDADNLELLAERNDQLNAVLGAGADAYGFTAVVPRLTTLCQPVDPEVGRDLQGLDDPYPFHPTGVGMVRLASPVFAAIDPPTSADD